jgi:hypothetical protein
MPIFAYFLRIRLKLMQCVRYTDAGYRPKVQFSSVQSIPTIGQNYRFLTVNIALRSFPEGRTLETRLRLQGKRLPTRTNNCNDSAHTPPLQKRRP